MIKRLENQHTFNPIREHININFDIVPDKLQQVEALVDDLLKQAFNPKLSRALVFARTKRIAEETAEAVSKCLTERKIDWASRVGVFHAGMDSGDRDKNYEEFKLGEKVVLVATKAFGMGMDIENIHYVYHLGPSSTFEDFLQEVGRAGRKEEDLKKAGFSNENPIKTKCFLTKDDFRHLADLNHKNSISWNAIKLAQKKIHSFVGAYKSDILDKSEPFPLPFDLLNFDPDLEEKKDTDGVFRLALYWLERLGRIRLELFTPTSLPISFAEKEPDFTIIQDFEKRTAVNAFLNSLKEYKAITFPDGNDTMILMPIIKKLSGNKGRDHVYKLLFLAQKTKAITINRYISLQPTNLRSEELKSWVKPIVSPTIEAVFSLAKVILNGVKPNEQKVFCGDDLNIIIDKVADEYFLPNKIYWTQKRRSGEQISAEEICQDRREDFVKTRAKFAFKLIRMLPNIKFQSIINIKDDHKKPEVVQIVHNDNNGPLLEQLHDLKQSLYELISHIQNTFVKENKKVFNYAGLALHLKLEDKRFDYFSNLLFLSKGLGYLKGEGAFMPMGIELFIEDVSEINEEDNSSRDFTVYKEFLENSQLKELRILALQCFSERNSRREQETFINKYFKSATLSDLVNLLEEYYDKEHEIFKIIKKEALAREESRLNEEQRKVYDAPIESNLQVVAGPGSGKTHTLILRVARLIQKEKVDPEQILILAYNRAVVVELKDRLTKLFKELGYGKLVSRLKIFTFHGFCMHCLDNNLDKSNFDFWVSAFLIELERNPGLIYQKLGQIKYVFVDEFQDITSIRLRLLTKIALPDRTRVCVIGDPNQSIYGYERVNEGESRSPRKNYDEFNSIYNPITLNLVQNYRSLPDILDRAEKFIALNKETFQLKPLKADLTANSKDYVQFKKANEYDMDWLKDLSILLTEINPETSKKYRQIAVMFRSNIEVFRAHSLVQNFIDSQKISRDNIRIRIQGEGEDFTRLREIAWIIDIYKNVAEKLINSNEINFKKIKDQVKLSFPNWDPYYFELFESLLYEFEKQKEEDSTYGELIDFIQDVSRKDAGQLSKIYNSYLSSLNMHDSRTEIVLTTMHKVKGLEFDAVLIPCSIANIELKKEEIALFLENGFTEEEAFHEYIEEERRIYYVAYTRAKYRLIVYWGRREEALKNSAELIFDADFGVSIPSGFEKFFISWGAKEYNFIRSFKFIEENIKVGDPVELIQKAGNTNTNGNKWNEWVVTSNSTIVGRLVDNIFKDLNSRELSGFVVSGVYRYTLEDTIEYDKLKLDRMPLKLKTDYISHWGESAVNKKYIYLVEFSGFGTA
jgi:superfamily I DNA/RNA helicase